MLSITPSPNLCHQLNFSLNLINPIELYAFANKTNLPLANAAFTLNGFDDQERNLTFVKTDFQV